MKKVVVTALALTLALSAVGCSSKKKEPATEAKTEAKTEAAKTEEVTEAKAAVEEAVSEAAAKVEEAVTEAADKAEEVVSEAGAAVATAKADVEEAVSEATGAVEEAVSEATAAVELPARDKPYKAAVLVPGTLGDKSFWDSTNEGLTALNKELGDDMFQFEVVEMGAGANDMASYPDFFLDACEDGDYDVIITGSWTGVEALKEAMEE